VEAKTLMEEQNQYDIVVFNNVDSEDFNGMWGGVEGGTYFVPAKTTKQFPRFLADHFAKALAVRILAREGKDFANDSPFLKEKMGEILQASIKVNPVTETITAEPKEEVEFPEVAEEIAEASQTLCSYCGKVYKTEAALKAHKTRQHNLN
jgi:hypothetical protein